MNNPYKPGDLVKVFPAARYAEVVTVSDRGIEARYEDGEHEEVTAARCVLLIRSEDMQRKYNSDIQQGIKAWEN